MRKYVWTNYTLLVLFLVEVERERERELYTRIWLNGSIKILIKVKDKHKNGKLIFSDVKKEKKKE